MMQFVDPNVIPSPGAASETFLISGVAEIIAIPSVTTTVSINSALITLAPGGTPIGGPLPSGVQLLNGVTPTFSEW